MGVTNYKICFWTKQEYIYFNNCVVVVFYLLQSTNCSGGVWSSCNRKCTTQNQINKFVNPHNFNTNQGNKSCGGIFQFLKMFNWTFSVLQPLTILQKYMYCINLFLVNALLSTEQCYSVCICYFLWSKGRCDRILSNLHSFHSISTR